MNKARLEMIAANEQELEAALETGVGGHIQEAAEVLMDDVVDLLAEVRRLQKEVASK